MLSAIFKGLKTGKLANQVLAILSTSYGLAASAQGVSWYATKLGEFMSAHDLAAHYVTEEQLKNMQRGNAAHTKAATKYAKAAKLAFDSGELSNTGFESLSAELKRLGIEHGASHS
ncbi:hypothetical protein [Ottowia sp.]|uniref:hypothetical protein n=1 Tax=Ottowia sp. TaxID=1898956 RepID=UPI002BA7A382|nr:hypothetical protein [Ottowia sp.]HRN76269.1 hypothetical protein [Ottowia sp.]HRQ02978.1 hypothetical protein [Ottowia sp.]